jgi:PPOX class probable F420-dependent enzyme
LATTTQRRRLTPNLRGANGTIAGVIDDTSAERLRSAPLAWLTTVRADGQPQTSYVWFHHDGEDIVLLSQPKAPKIRNIQGNPKVSLHLDGDTVTGDSVLTLEGTARLIGEMPSDRWLSYLAKYESRIRKGPWGTPDGFISVFSAAIRIVPTRVRAW